MKILISKTNNNKNKPIKNSNINLNYNKNQSKNILFLPQDHNLPQEHHHHHHHLLHLLNKIIKKKVNNRAVRGGVVGKRANIQRGIKKMMENHQTSNTAKI